MVKLRCYSSCVYSYRAAQTQAQQQKLKLWKNFTSNNELSLKPSERTFKAAVCFLTIFYLFI